MNLEQSGTLPKQNADQLHESEESLKIKNLKSISLEMWQKLSGIIETLILKNPNFEGVMVENVDTGEEIPFAEWFVENHLNRLTHSPQWHKHDILTHCKMVERYLKLLLISLKNDEVVQKELNFKIAGIAKSRLLELFGAICHDLGKWGNSTFWPDGQGGVKMVEHVDSKTKQKLRIPSGLSHRGHEARSGEIVLDKDKDGNSLDLPVYSFLKDRFQNPAQNGGLDLSDEEFADVIKYISKISELHYQLGDVRNKGRETLEGLLAWIDTLEFKEEVLKIFNDPEKKPYALEIVLFYLSDSQGKLDIKIIEGIIQDLPENYTIPDILKNLKKTIPGTSTILIDHVAKIDPLVDDIALFIKSEEFDVNAVAQDLLEKEPKLDITNKIKKSFLAGVIQYPENLKLYYKALEIWREWKKAQEVVSD